MKLSISVSFVFLAYGTWVARAVNGTQYELSIYQSTPHVFWVAVVFATAIGLFHLFREDSTHTQILSSGLLVLTISVITALPLVRGYFFYGAGDPMTHLGWVKQLLWGELDVRNFFYPGLHLLSGTLSITLDMSARRALNIAAWLFVPVWLIFMPLLVRELTESHTGWVVGIAVALTLIPLNPINVRVIPLPSAQMILFAPFPLYLYLQYFKRPNTRRLQFSVLLPVVFTAVVFYHPQQALNILVVIGTFTVLSNNFRDSSSRFSNTGVPLILACGAILMMWIVSKQPFEDSAGILLAGMAQVVQEIILGGGGDTSSAAAATSRFGSARALGYSIPVLLFKMLGKNVLIGIAALCFLVIASYKEFDLQTRLLAISSLPVIGFFVAFIAAGQFNQWMRYAGFLAAIVSITSAVGLARMIESDWRPTVSKSVVVCIVCLSLVLSVPIIFQSPYIAVHNRQVTESQYSGYELAFENADQSIPFLHIRAKTQRFESAIYGSTDATPISVDYFPQQGKVPDHFANQSLENHYNAKRYLSVTSADVTRETRLYQGYRYTMPDFRYLERSANRIVDNGGYRLYLIEG